MRVTGFETAQVEARPLCVDDWEGCAQTRHESALTPRQARGDVLALGPTDPAGFEAMIIRRAEWMDQDRHYALGPSP